MIDLCYFLTAGNKLYCYITQLIQNLPDMLSVNICIPLVILLILHQRHSPNGKVYKTLKNRPKKTERLVQCLCV